MTQQEEQLIRGLIDRVSSTRLPEKDTDAERTLQDGLGRNPDALYILAQTVLVQQLALEQLQRQLAEARRGPEQSPLKKATSFLGSIFGHEEAPPPPPPPSYSGGYQPVPGTVQQGGYGATQYGQGVYGAAPALSMPGGGPGGQTGGFLRGALQTATGVAAGALAFEGIESLMHGFGSGGGGREFGDMGARPEAVVNNYYGESAPDRFGQGGLSPDIEDRRGDAGDTFGDRLAATDATGLGGNDPQGGDDGDGDDYTDDAFDGGSDGDSNGDGDLGGGGDFSGGDDLGGGDNY